MIIFALAVTLCTTVPPEVGDPPDYLGKVECRMYDPEWLTKMRFTSENACGDKRRELYEPILSRGVMIICYRINTD